MPNSGQLFMLTKKRLLLFSVTVLIICGAFITSIASMTSPSFTHITLEEWYDLDLFTPLILEPPPGRTELRMGPYLAEGADRVELHYTEEFVPNDATSSAYTLYESNKPILVGQEILSPYDARKDSVTIERVELVLFGRTRSVEIRRNKHYANSGIAIFEIEGTYIVYHWQNVTENRARNQLTESLTLVQ
jgi:hypothetical protein